MRRGPAPGSGRAGGSLLSRPGRRTATAAALTVAVLVVATGCTRSGTATTTTGPTTTVTTVSAWGQPAPAGSGVLEAVSCGDAVHCWAVGRAAVNPLTSTTTTAGATASPGPSIVIDATADGGVTWSAEAVTVADPTDLDGVACPDRRHCMAVGNADQGGPILGTVLVTADGGQTWQPVGSPTGAVDVAAVQCFSATACIVLASDGSSIWSASTMDGGQVWQRTGSLPPGFGGVSNLSCLTTTACVTVGYTTTAPGQGTGAIAVTNDGGTTWTAATIPAGVGKLHGVSCTGIADCVAVGTKATVTTNVVAAPSQVLRSDDGGATWTEVTSPDGVGDAFSVSCPTTDNCATVGTVWTVTDPPTPIGGVVTSGDGGSTWETADARYIPAGLTDVDCPVPTACVAAGNNIVARIALHAPNPATLSPGSGLGSGSSSGSGSGL